MSNPPADRWATTLTKRFLSAELKAGRTPKRPPPRSAAARTPCATTLWSPPSPNVTWRECRPRSSELSTG